MKKILSLAVILMLFVSAYAGVKKCSRQTIYVPAYAHIYMGAQVRPFDLAITLSIRNTSAEQAVTVTRADFHSTDGTLLKSFVTKPVTLGPLATAEYVVSESESQGGSGANFIVKWQSEKDVTEPVVESVMIGTRSQQGISFTSRGVVTEE